MGGDQFNKMGSSVSGEVLRRYIAIGLFLGVVSKKKKIVCVNTLHCVFIYLALFSGHPFSPGHLIFISLEG